MILSWKTCLFILNWKVRSINLIPTDKWTWDIFHTGWSWSIIQFTCSWPTNLVLYILRISAPIIFHIGPVVDTTVYNSVDHPMFHKSMFACGNFGLLIGINPGKILSWVTIPMRSTLPVPWWCRCLSIMAPMTRVQRNLIEKIPCKALRQMTLPSMALESSNSLL